jgi:hypothetical protein
MILQFKNTVSGIKVKNDTGNTIVTIKKESIFSSAKLISTNNEVLYHTAILDEKATKESWNRSDERKYVLYNNEDSTFITAKLIFAKDAGKLSIIKTPQVERLILETPFGEWEAVCQKDFSVLIVDKNEVIGKITPFYGIRQQIFACADKYPASMWAGLYVLVDYMMHEDKLIVA